MNPMAFFVAFIFLSALTGYYFPIVKLFAYPWILTGAPFILFGGYLFMNSGKNMQESKTTFRPNEKPSALVTGGAFRITRNPIYLSVVMFLTGEALLFGAISSLIYPLIFMALVNALVIPKEEAVLENVFGQEYLAYKKKVRRWM